MTALFSNRHHAPALCCRGIFAENRFTVFGIPLGEDTMVKRAEGADHDPHLAWELVMGADGICAALEAGVE